MARRRLGAPRTAVLDAHDQQALEEFVHRIDEVDHLVSMVGESMSGGFLTTSPDTMRHVLMSKFWANWMIGRPCSAKIRTQGTITFTAGTGGRPHEISASYVANLGLGALVRGLAVGLAPRVRVNAVVPTLMSTPFWKALTQSEFETAEREFTRGVPPGSPRHGG
jgi:NAD(P)-dependent dehydrogenase (short-subunit alcohol dehydrogenase family)